MLIIMESNNFHFWDGIILFLIFILVAAIFVKPSFAQPYPGTVNSQIWGENGVDCAYQTGEDPKSNYCIYYDGGCNLTDSNGYVSKGLGGGNHTIAVTIPPNYQLMTSCGASNPVSVYVNGNTQTVNFPIFTYNINGWLYTETNNSVTRANENLEGLIPNYTVNLYDYTGGVQGSQLAQVTSAPNPVTGPDLTAYTANYLFTPFLNGNYLVKLVVTPTGSVLFPPYTNPQVVQIGGGPAYADFPFITVTPSVTPGATITGPGLPSATPTPTTNLTPTATPSIQVTPTPLITQPASCLTLPTPILVAPAHTLCTNSKPTFSAYVEDPNGDNAWAQFYSNAYEKFNRMGSVVVPPYPTGTYSQYVSDSSMLNSTGGYWWTAYTKSSTCPQSNDAPAQLLNMDYSPPGKPGTPTCTFQPQNLYTGECAFSCSWQDDPETDASCGNTSDYHPILWTNPLGGGGDYGWCVNSSNPSLKCIYNSGSNSWSISGTIQSGESLYGQVQAKDSVDNLSAPSEVAGPFVCPFIIPQYTPTPGGPTYTPTPSLTPSVTPSPTITPTPTPGSWMQVKGGDIYQKNIIQDVPAGQYLLEDIQSPSNPNSGGLVRYSQTLNTLNGSTKQSNDWKQQTSLSNAFNFPFYWKTLSEQAASINNSIVGAASDLDGTKHVYSYSGSGTYTVDPNLKANLDAKGLHDVVFTVSGTLMVNNNIDFSTAPSDVLNTLVFIVNGHIYVDSTVTTLYGLYLSGCNDVNSCNGGTFTVATSNGTDQPITINGMVYAYDIQLLRNVPNFSTPAFKFIYQPQYVVKLLQYMGRSQVNWQEAAP